MKRKVRHVKQFLIFFLMGALFTLITVVANGASIINSRHDLHWAASLPNMVFWDTYNDYGEVCVYCHTPHGGDSSAPLWNRVAPTGPYNMYNSSTMDTSVPGTPSGISLACLSCHDGTVAVDYIVNMPGPGWSPGGAKGDLDSWKNSPRHGKLTTTGDPLVNCAVACHGGAVIAETDFTQAILGTDLSNDHPISMTYPEPAQDPDFKTPAEVGSGGLKLFNNKVECSSCHDVHDPAITPFLRKSNITSALCSTCHIK